MRHERLNLLPYGGKWVAWAPDGSRIVAAEADLFSLCNNLRSRGEDPSRFVFEDIPPPETEGFVIHRPDPVTIAFQHSLPTSPQAL